jgi:Protein of unknown function (DUF4231)
MDQPNIPHPPKDEKDRFAEFIEEARSIKEKNIDPTIDHYKTHIAGPRSLFLSSGILTILLSVALPAVSIAPFPSKEIVLSGMSVTIAALTALSSFFRWERTWRGNITAKTAIEQYCAKWELELTNARLRISEDERITHVYKATSDLLANVSNVVSSESEGFFSNLQFPHQDSSKKV